MNVDTKCNLTARHGSWVVARSGGPGRRAAVRRGSRAHPPGYRTLLGHAGFVYHPHPRSPGFLDRSRTFQRRSTHLRCPLYTTTLRPTHCAQPALWWATRGAPPFSTTQRHRNRIPAAGRKLPTDNHMTGQSTRGRHPVSGHAKARGPSHVPSGPRAGDSSWGHPFVISNTQLGAMTSLQPPSPVLRSARATSSGPPGNRGPQAPE